jgi:hypothetical protein
MQDDYIIFLFMITLEVKEIAEEYMKKEIEMLCNISLFSRGGFTAWRNLADLCSALCPPHQ